MYEEIVKRYRPRGWRLVFSRRKSKYADDQRVLLMRKNAPEMERNALTLAVADPNKKVIHAPYVVDEFTLAILLHEFGHVKLEHWGRGEAPSHRQEFEAEKWALNIMELEGVVVPAYVTRAAKRYIRRCIKEDKLKGEPIQPHVKRFAKKDPSL